MEKSIWKAVAIVALALGMTGCANMYAEHTSVEIYNPKTGVMIGKAYSNKGYDGFVCKGHFDECGSGDFEWRAHKVTSNSVAKQVGENNKELTRSLTGLVRKVAGIPSPNPFNR